MVLGLFNGLIFLVYLSPTNRFFKKMRLARSVNIVGRDLIFKKFKKFFWSCLGPGGKALLLIPGKNLSRSGG